MRLTILITFLLSLSGSALNAQSQRRIPLSSWASPSRIDTYTTAFWNPDVDGPTHNPDYIFFRDQGSILRDPVPGTVPLYHWYSPSRGDNITTTLWSPAGGTTRSPDYSFVRTEGHVFNKPLAGTVPLYSWFSASAGNNYLTTDSNWAGGAGARRAPDYRRQGSLDGYIFPPTEFDGIDNPADFGYDQAPVRGSVPLLVIIADFTDFPLAFDEDYIEREVFGPEQPNVLGMFNHASGGRFRFTRGGVSRVPLGPTTIALPRYDETILRWAQDIGGTDFVRFDTDRDGFLENDEIAVLVVTSNFPPVPRGGAQTRGIPTTRLTGVTTRNLTVSFADEYGELNLKAHELMHFARPGGQHIYGPGAQLNYSASFFAGNIANNLANPVLAPFQLDPWHRMLCGWMEPRVMRITDAGGSTAISARSNGGSTAPLILYDPERSKDEFFFVEYRNPNASGVNYDSGTRSQGVAVWLVRRNAAGVLDDLTWPPPGYSGDRTPTRSGHVFAHYVIGPEGAGVLPYWTESSGEGSFLWSDGTDSGLRIRVGPLAPEQLTVRVQWRRAGRPFVPRIDRVTPTAIDSPARIVIDGEFPARRNDTIVQLRARAAAGGGLYGVRWVSHDVNRLIVDVDATVPTGTYQISIRSSPASGCDSNPIQVTINAPLPPPTVDIFRRADANGDAAVDISDGLAILQFLFLGEDLECIDAADTDDSGTVNLGDAIVVFGYLFLGGDAIPSFGTCGRDRTQDPLVCVAYDGCE